MGTFQNVQAWLKQAASVSPQGDSDAPWTEGQDAATVNNYARSNMSAVKKYAEDTGGVLVATGTADAITVTTNQVLSAAHLAAGLRLLVRTTAANTIQNVTFAPDGLTAALITRADGTAFQIGEIRSGDYLDLVYNAGSSNWRCVNHVSGGAGRASFRANKNGTNQSVPTGVTTKITFTTEAWDTGAYYTSVNSLWTPPVGTAMISAQVGATAFAIANAAFSIRLYKNGALLMMGQRVTTGPIGGLPVIGGTWTDQCGGADYYEIYVSHNDSGANVMDGTITQTWFSGTML